MGLALRRIRFCYFYHFLLHPFGDRLGDKDPFAAEKDLPFLAPLRTAFRYRTLYQHADKCSLLISNQPAALQMRFRVEARVFETGFGTVRIDVGLPDLQDCGPADDIDIDGCALHVLCNLGTIKLGDTVPGTPASISFRFEGFRLGADNDEPILWQVFKQAIECSLREVPNSRWADDGIANMVEFVLRGDGKESDKLTLLVARDGINQVPRLVVVLEPPISPLEGDQAVEWVRSTNDDPDKGPLLRNLFFIPLGKSVDWEALASDRYRAALPADHGNCKLANYLPVQEIFVWLWPVRSVIVFPGVQPGHGSAGADFYKIWRKEVARLLSDIGMLYLSSYEFSIANAYIDERIQEFPLLLDEIRKELRGCEERGTDFARLLLGMQERLARLMTRDRALLSRVFEEPVHAKMWYGGARTVLNYYLQELNLSDMWHIGLQKLVCLGRLYDEIMDYLRIRDAQQVEQHMQQEERSSRRRGED